MMRWHFVSCEEADENGQTNGWVELGPGVIDICGGDCDVFANFGAIDLIYGCPPPD